MNWYSRIIKADASSGTPTGDVEMFPYEGGDHIYQLFSGELGKKAPVPEIGNDEVVVMDRSNAKATVKKDSIPFSRVNDQTNSKPVVDVPFNIGDKLRYRARGMGDKQDYGTVIAIDDNEMSIKWDGKKEIAKIPLTETSYLAQQIDNLSR